MTSATQLYTLQDLDLVLDRLDSQKAEAERELGLGPAVERLEASLAEEELKLEEFRTLFKPQQLEVETQRDRSTHLDEQLYGGSITSPRDLANLEQEASNVRQQLEKQDTDLVALSLQTEESQAKFAALETELAETRATWVSRQAELKDQIGVLAAEQEDLAKRRGTLVETLEPVALQQYERIRMTKGGLAVAKVERGLCQGCRMSLPTQQQQQVRSGRQTVLCSSCGRILILG